MDLGASTERVEHLECFRLLDLPAELRLMIYEFISMTTRHCGFEYIPRDSSSKPISRPVAIKLVIKSLPISLLSTCKLVNAETAPIFAPKFDVLRAEPMRLVVDSANISTFFAKHGHGFSGYNPSGYSFNLEVSKHLYPERHASGKLHAAFDHDIKPIGYDQALSRESEDIHSRLLKAIKCDNFNGANLFFRTCATFLTSRQPSSTCIAITRHPLADLDDILSAIRQCIVDQSSWSELRKPVGFMLRVTMTDEFDDPRSPNHPEGAKRGGLREDLTHRHANAYPGALATRHVDDVGEAEWEEVWGENTK